MAKPGKTVYENFYSPKKKKKKKGKQPKAKVSTMNANKSEESIPSFHKEDPLYGSPLFPYAPKIIPNSGYFTG